MMPKIDFFVCALTVTFDAVVVTDFSSHEFLARYGRSKDEALTIEP